MPMSSGIEAVRQVTDQGHCVAEVAERLGITACSLYAWKSQSGKGEVVRRVEAWTRNAEQCVVSKQSCGVSPKSETS